ncbi:hypothetical protein [Leisingera thetidis]|uniref:hypothetical protein n=1 Tax=Leisingera thetidis TaxID=2930199 RepID=UPI0021F79C9C|nr:hypothetical protein [Leisingera thetidis]
MVAQILQANAAEIGLVAGLNGQDEGTFWSADASRAADLELHVESWTGSSGGICTMQYFALDQIGAWNREGPSNPECDAWVQKGRTSTDETERGKPNQKMQELMVEADGPASAMIEPRAACAAKAEFAGRLGLGIPLLSGGSAPQRGV